jgi:hypothetical protein
MGPERLERLRLRGLKATKLHGPTAVVAKLAELGRSRHERLNEMPESVQIAFERWLDDEGIEL